MRTEVQPPWSMAITAHPSRMDRPTASRELLLARTAHLPLNHQPCNHYQGVRDWCVTYHASGSRASRDTNIWIKLDSGCTRAAAQRTGNARRAATLDSDEPYDASSQCTGGWPLAGASACDATHWPITKPAGFPWNRQYYAEPLYAGEATTEPAVQPDSTGADRDLAVGPGNSAEIKARSWRR